MKKTFPKYNKRSLKPLFDKFKPKDKKLLEDFLVHCGGTAGKTTINKYRSVLTKICDVFGGDLDKIDLKRLREFLNTLNQSNLLPPTKNEIKKVLKRFLRETYEDWFSRFKELKDIKTENDINQNKINSNTILREGEIEQLVRGAENLRYKATIMLFYETAGRPEEILKLKWKDVNLKNGDVKLHSSKTGNIRVNPIQKSVIHLKRFKEEWPYMNVSPDDFVFVSPQDRTKHISGVACGKVIKLLGQKVLKRDIFLYLIRHSRLTELQKVLPAKVYEKFADHSIETATRYSHLDKEDIRKAMFDMVYDVEEISDEKKHELELKFEKVASALQNSNKVMKETAKSREEERDFFKSEINQLKENLKNLSSSFSLKMKKVLQSSASSE